MTRGYVVFHMQKARGTDSGTSAHIERKVEPSNADEERTHMNRRLIEYPDGVHTRTQAIQHRLETAGLTRKVGKNQVRAIRIMLSGSPDDMQRIVREGRLDEWCADNMKYLAETFGRENIVSADLHLDETSPHIHATLVPIVTTERKRKKQEEHATKRYRTKSASRPRLCADDVMSRIKLKEYQDTYAKAMAKYGLKRGVEGSEARHVTTQEFYREMFVRKNEIAEQVVHLKEQQQTLTVDIAALQVQQEVARSELAQTRREIKTDKLKGAAVDATAKAVERIGTLFHDPKPARYEKQIADLQGIIDDRDKRIGQLQHEVETMKAGHRKEVAELKQEAHEVLKAFARVDDLFPYVKGLLKWENYCKTVGLNKEQTRTLFTMQPFRYTGDLCSVRYGLTFKADDVVLQFRPDKKGPGGFRFTINGKEDDAWFCQQRKEMYERMGINIERTEQRQRMKI